MMTVFEYASDMNKTVEEILNLCQTLGIEVNDKDDELSDDDIILLDNEIENTESINNDDAVAEDNVDDVDDFDDDDDDND